VKASQQGSSFERHLANPRTLIFVTSIHPQSGGREVLLLRGSAHKRLWSGLYNGLGGHVEVGEDILSAAERELAEESGLTGVALHLRGVVHIDTREADRSAQPGVLVFVFCGHSTKRTIKPSAEGTPEWIPVDDLEDLPLVDDLFELLPRLLEANAPTVYARYAADASATMQFHFRTTEPPTPCRPAIT
jgi:8-oxo-dGTP diphosphatase